MESVSFRCNKILNLRSPLGDRKFLLLKVPTQSILHLVYPSKVFSVFFSCANFQYSCRIIKVTILLWQHCLAWFGKFWKAGRVKQLRQRLQKIRKVLQEAKKIKVVKHTEQRQRRIITHIDRVISKQLVRFAKDFGMGLRFEDLSGIRQTSKQHKKIKSDAAKNRDRWAYYQLEYRSMVRFFMPSQSSEGRICNGYS